MFTTFLLRFWFAASCGVGGYVSHGTFAGDRVAGLLSPSPAHVAGISLRA